jgi:hypothetical protein
MRGSVREWWADWFEDWCLDIGCRLARTLPRGPKLFTLFFAITALRCRQCEGLMN